MSWVVVPALVAGVLGWFGGGLVPNASAQEGATPPHWIWYPTDAPLEAIPAETRYFRKVFHVKEPSRVVIDVTADNAFTLYLDGEKIAEGANWQRVQRVETRVPTGLHVLAAEVSNEAPGPAGFLLGGGVLPLGQGVPIHTNASWRTTGEVPDDGSWTRLDFDDSDWRRAADLGVLGTGPWQDLVFDARDPSSRFQVPEGFSIAMVAAPEVTGSAVAFTFDHEGRPCVSIERGPIVRLVDHTGDGIYDDRFVVGPEMNNCQGLHFDVRPDGEVTLWAVGDGPQGTGIYHWKDDSGDGVYDTVLHYVPTDGMGEHGPHAIIRGPDGLLYFNSGNHAHIKEPVDPRSPVNEHFIYEGELLPHYNDARGHAAGVMAPGGEIYRSRDDGRTWERISAGYRNHYDFAFNRAGEIFTFDSDMEWDIGLPWYRPVRVNHATIGSEFGWRNGSAKWPDYFFDSLPTTLDTGRGSPTGVTFYHGHAFPDEYEDAFLICDWSQGQILAVTLTPRGATYAAEATELVTGQPLNCTDIEVGPDGAVYFTNGGRNTQGGLFRVAWNAAQTYEPPDDPIEEALAIPSPLSSYSRARVQAIREALGDEFSTKLAEVAVNAEAPAPRRIRALDLLSDAPDGAGKLVMLMALAEDKSPDVRARAVTMLGQVSVRRDDERAQACRQVVIARLSDDDPVVRRRACEALMAQPPEMIPVAELLPLLADSDRWLRYAARVALEHGDVTSFWDQLVAHPQPWVQLEGMLALVRTTPLDATHQNDLFGPQRLFLKALAEGRLDREQGLALLRLIGLTYMLGPQKPAETPEATAEFRRLALEAFPSGDRATDWELARLLAYLNELKAIAKILDAQESGDADRPTQIHYAYCLRVITDGWLPETKARFWSWFETASRWDGGFSYLGYLDFMIQELVAQLSPGERGDYLGRGSEYPFPTRVLVRTIDLNDQPERIAELVVLYGRLDETDNPSAANELRALIIERMGQSRRAEARATLRELFESDPARRNLIARAMASRPSANDLPLLVEALEARDPNTLGAVLNALGRIEESPDGPEGLLNLIRMARRAGPQVRDPFVALARKWTGDDVDAPSDDFSALVAAWEQLYAERFPDGPPIVDDATAEYREYALQELVEEILQTDLMKRGSPERGKAVIAKARCLDCHTFGDEGQGLGPDLTTVSSRFSPEEILESIVEPSKVISDQYQSIAVATLDGQVFTGMPVASGPDELVLLLSDGTRVTIPQDEIEEQALSDVSVMPDGLLNELTLQEIADMLALFDSAPRVEIEDEPDQE